MIARIYRTVLPLGIRKAIANARSEIFWLRFNKFFKENPELKLKYENEIRFFDKIKRGLVFPYEFALKYKEKDIQVKRDESKALYYVMHGDKKLYFPESMSIEKIQNIYNSLLMEQDMKSPHRYLTKEFNITEETILADVGCAEGILALESIERAKRVYLFEYDTEWVKALEATFMPWQDKVTIVPKYVSDKSGSNTTTIDDYFRYIQGSLLIKMDVEGSEEAVLAGAAETLNREHIKILCCTYHRQNDSEKFRQFFNSKGFQTEFSEGYMFFMQDKFIKPPYFRKGLIRAWK
jgi:hypothetical protein